jgi:hypothetical protein
VSRIKAGKRSFVSFDLADLGWGMAAARGKENSGLISRGF